MTCKLGVVVGGTCTLVEEVVEICTCKLVVVESALEGVEICTCKEEMVVVDTS